MRHFYFFFRWLFIELCYMLWLVLFTEKTGHFMLAVTEILPQTLVTKTVLCITKVVIRSSYCINWATSNVKVFWTLYPYHGEWRRLPVILSYSNMNCKKNIIENAFPRMFFHTADMDRQAFTIWRRIFNQERNSGKFSQQGNSAVFLPIIFKLVVVF